MTKFRVDVVTEDRVPCGMNSIRYLGNSERAGRKALADSKVGMDCWGNPNLDYYPVLSQWDPVAREYRIIASRKHESVV